MPSAANARSAAPESDDVNVLVDRIRRAAQGLDELNGRNGAKCDSKVEQISRTLKGIAEAIRREPQM